MTRASFITSAILLALGVPVAIGAWQIGAPIPFLAAPLLMTVLIMTIFGKAVPSGYVFAPRTRVWVMTVIGVAIGTQVTPELLGQLPDYLPSLLAMTLFIPTVHALNYRILRKVGGLSPINAYFSAAPGGFVESVTMAEQNGGTLRVVAMQHFMRIILVIVLIPMILSLYVGFPVGQISASKAMLSAVPVHHLALIAALAIAGFLIAQRIKLPAGHLVGPLLVTAVATGSGLLPVFTVPQIIIAGAQIIVGLSLGSRFAGVTGAEIKNAAKGSILCVAAALMVGFAASEGLFLATGVPLEILVLAFAPGGVTEMGLIALSLSGNPAVVVLHHVYRIIITVLMMIGFLKHTDFLEQAKV